MTSRLLSLARADNQSFWRYQDEPKCYACDAKAVGLRAEYNIFTQPRGKYVPLAPLQPAVVPACARHAEAKGLPGTLCTYCSAPVRRGSYVDDEGRCSHVVCHKEQCR